MATISSVFFGDPTDQFRSASAPQWQTVTVGGTWEPPATPATSTAPFVGYTQHLPHLPYVTVQPHVFDAETWTVVSTGESRPRKRRRRAKKVQHVPLPNGDRNVVVRDRD